MKCKNCEQHLQKENNYCNHCGAKVIDYRLTIRNVAEEFTQVFLNIDNTFLRTFFQMFIHPERVILDYISGVRKRYLNVISYFTIALTLAGFQLFILKKFYPETLETPNFYRNTDFVMDLSWLFDYQFMLTLLYLPMLALIASLSFIKYKKFNYTEHLVTMTYLMAHFTIFSGLISLPMLMFKNINYIEIDTFLYIVLFFYTCYTYKKMYPLTVKQLLFSIFLFFIFTTITYIIIVIVMTAVLFLTGDMQELIEASRASR